MTPPHFAFRLLAALLVVPTAGCLSSSYVIPREDAIALAQLPPEQRGESVRVVQQIFVDEPATAPSVNSSTQIYVGPHVYVTGGIGGGGGVVGGGGAGGGGTTGGGVGGGTVAVTPPAGGGTVGVTPPPGGGTVAVTPGGPNPGGTGTTGGSGSSGGGGDGAAVLVVVAIALSAVIALVLAGTEGARYDGWARLHPMAPVHVVGPDGSEYWVPLAQLDPQTAAWADALIVSEEEGPFQTLGRAPLHRVGFVYGMEVGAASLRGPRGILGAGFTSHLQFGFFPIQELGVLFDTTLGLGGVEGNSVVNAQFGGELQVLPLEAGLFHFGVFGRIGSASPSQRGDRWSLAGGGGPLVQVAITTRLALTLRAGLSYIDDARGGLLAGEGTVGLAVY